MNYLKAQQEVLAAILQDKPQNRVIYCKDYTAEEGERTALFPCGFYGYVIPSERVAVDLSKCEKFERLPFTICPCDEKKAITPTGVTVKSEEKKRDLVEFANLNGVPSYFDKKLLAKFGTDVQLYQEKQLNAATVTEGGHVIGYLFPVNYRRDAQS